MNIREIRRFLLWCTILNFALLLLCVLLTACAGDFIYGLQSAWYPFPRPTFDKLVYAFVGVYKLLILFFNVMPLLALWIVEKGRAKG